MKPQEESTMTDKKRTAEEVALCLLDIIDSYDSIRKQHELKLSKMDRDDWTDEHREISDNEYKEVTAILTSWLAEKDERIKKLEHALETCRTEIRRRMP